MLSRPPLARRPSFDTGSLPERQGGVVLMIALIILVALTLGGIALVRNVDTTNLVAGNLAFQQAATHAGEAGISDAVTNYLEATVPANLRNTDLSKGYVALVVNPEKLATPKTWDKYWVEDLNPNPVSLPVAAKTCVDSVCTLPTDAAGNTVSYVIHRLCQTAGDPLLTATGCAIGPQKNPLTGASLGSGNVPLPMITQYYYRITTRIVGPRNTISYIQTIVAR
jgi:type IV pilus assembly protein PilX